MFRLWGKIISSNHVRADFVAEDGSDLNRTRKVFAALEQIAHEFDIQVPIWLDRNIDEFRRRSHTRFSQDNFIEHIDFDWLEIQVIEEDI